MKTYSFRDKPLRIFGVVDFDKTGKLERLPDTVRKAIPSLSFLGRRCPGARLCFRTNAEKVNVTIELETFSPDVGMSIFAAQSAFVFVGERPVSRFAGLIAPNDYSEKRYSGSFTKSCETEDVTIYLPRNEVIADIRIEVDDGALVEAPTPYRDVKPVVYYGSSITEGGCSCNHSNAYNAILSRWLNVDYYNLGFSGRARGELAMADFINGIDMGVFVYDYDHNAPNLAHLESTHEPFFKRIREAHPDLPILMMSRPKCLYEERDKARRSVIRATYERAVAAGDKRVRFLDGETFFGTVDADLCTVDGTHPNDLGFYRMATVIRPVLEELIGMAEGRQ